ncbi:hypothetical protein B2J93_8054 [Marssonina coronariae]|uniref:Uncharacterized protein n=1 Tax=Diplocarpon coronariae TaxID=2795749 RepID=A0A218ZC44_9HELO|nr:hypothetical protein B2J93_8054 [Marssonina coronariae]
MFRGSLKSLSGVPPTVVVRDVIYFQANCPVTTTSPIVLAVPQAPPRNALSEIGADTTPSYEKSGDSTDVSGRRRAHRHFGCPSPSIAVVVAIAVAIDGSRCRCSRSLRNTRRAEKWQPAAQSEWQRGLRWRGISSCPWQPSRRKKQLLGAGAFSEATAGRCSRSAGEGAMYLHLTPRKYRKGSQLKLVIPELYGEYEEGYEEEEEEYEEGYEEYEEEEEEEEEEAE